jgi:hypothetical protein
MTKKIVIGRGFAPPDNGARRGGNLVQAVLIFC